MRTIHRSSEARAAARHPRLARSPWRAAGLVGGLAAMLLLALGLGSACTAGSPPHFKSKGDVWAIPVEGTQQGDLPIVQLEIEGKGPYAFVVAFGSTSSIDPALVKELGLWVTNDRHAGMVTEDTGATAASMLSFAQVNSLKMGELSMGRRNILVMPISGTFGDQRLAGIIGRDILSDTTIWHLDRDRGQLIIANQGHYAAPENATRMKISVNNYEVFTNLRTRAGREVYMRVTFEGGTAIDPEIADQARFQELGDGWLAMGLSAGDRVIEPLPMAPYRNERRIQNPIEGELGLAFWKRYNVTVNLHEQVVWLSNRQAPAAP